MIVLGYSGMFEGNVERRPGAKHLELAVTPKEQRNVPKTAMQDYLSRHDSARRLAARAGQAPQAGDLYPVRPVR